MNLDSTILATMNGHAPPPDPEQRRFYWTVLERRAGEWPAAERTALHLIALPGIAGQYQAERRHTREAS